MLRSVPRIPCGCSAAPTGSRSRATRPELARHLPSTGGDGDPDGVWAALCDLLEAPPLPLLDVLTRPPQTNEVARSASLIGGFLVVANETHRPLHVLEIGASAGLNLRFDRFRYEQGEEGYGPADSAVRFAGLWEDGQPPFDAPLEVSERRGCDLDPVDATTADGRLTLLSYVWPDQLERFARTAAAIDIAARVPAVVDRADATAWLTDRLLEPADGTTTVVFHSVMWQYLTDATRCHPSGDRERRDRRDPRCAARLASPRATRRPPRVPRAAPHHVARRGANACSRTARSTSGRWSGCRTSRPRASRSGGTRR